METQEKTLSEKESPDLIATTINKAKDSGHRSAASSARAWRVPEILIVKEYRIYKKVQALANV